MSGNRGFKNRNNQRAEIWYGFQFLLVELTIIIVESLVFMVFTGPIEGPVSSWISRSNSVFKIVMDTLYYTFCHNLMTYAIMNGREKKWWVHMWLLVNQS